MLARFLSSIALISLVFDAASLVDARSIHQRGLAPIRHHNNDIQAREAYNPFRPPPRVDVTEQDEIIARSVQGHVKRTKKMGGSKRQRKVKKRQACGVSASNTATASVTVVTASSTSTGGNVMSTLLANNNAIVPTVTTSATSSAVAATTAATTTTTSKTSTSTKRITVDPEGDGPFAGETTYYNLGTDGSAIGACGNSLVDSDLIAAASEYLFDSWPGATGNPNTNPICGLFAKVTYQGTSVVVRIEDRCPGCDKRHLDLSPSAFTQLAPESVGLMDVTWSWVATASG